MSEGWQILLAINSLLGIFVAAVFIREDLKKDKTKTKVYVLGTIIKSIGIVLLGLYGLMLIAAFITILSSMYEFIKLPWREE